MPNEEEKTDKRLYDELYEDIDDEEMSRLVLEAQREMFIKSRKKQPEPKPNPFVKWIVWGIAIAMIVNTFAFLLQSYSIPAIEFLKTSATLSADSQIKEYKKSVVTVVLEESKGTGFSISSDGLILTNYHVIEGNETATVVFPDDGRYLATVIHTDPAVDLAVLSFEGENLPYLVLAEATSFYDKEPIHFIGNPLSFHGIANEGTIIDYISLSSWNRPVIMIDAPVYRGNSGSPIINQDGLVIGIIFATMKHDDYGKVGLFIPIDYYYQMIHT